MPDDAKIALAYGYALSEAGDFADAESQLHKAAYLMHGDSAPQRALAWVMFLNGKFEQAASQYESLMSESPTANDCLNAGHVEWALGHVAKAIDHYKNYVRMAPDNDLDDEISKDLPHLAKAGADLSLRPLIIEAVKYTDNNII